MIEIKDLLTRFNKLLLSKEGQTDTIRNVISEIIKVNIKKEDIKIKNNIIYLNIKSIYKNEILIKQDKILLKLKEILGSKIPENIR